MSEQQIEDTDTGAETPKRASNATRKEAAKKAAETRRLRAVKVPDDFTLAGGGRLVVEQPQATATEPEPEVEPDPEPEAEEQEQENK